MLLGLLVAAATIASPVFPQRMCERLPAVSGEVEAWADRVAPDLAHVPVRELAVDAALDLFRRAAEAGWGSVELFTRDVFREPCVFYLHRDTLRSVDESFELDLVTAVRGTDEDGRPFEMAAILAGNGKLLLFYERGGIVYFNEREQRSFELASRVELETPARGRLEEVRGLCAEVALLGCVDIESLVKEGDTITVEAGPFTTESRVTPIKLRDPVLARE
ncbi:MAG: hypothetical protein AB1689_18145 [Thermodesulfobacteriota bacterium]